MMLSRRRKKPGCTVLTRTEFCLKKSSPKDWQSLQGLVENEIPAMAHSSGMFDSAEETSILASTFFVIFSRALVLDAAQWTTVGRWHGNLYRENTQSILHK